ncbi:hypothetical protein BCR33DRAFT_80961 [Rhizoclosmatium globosum]|uniref:Zn(2)-C6 fungal-type domain-containing protein n=1 Tax=Rhizoclosmatium globosum TaxID=329046 RepID=A0A1Y2CLH8_9FUNG|nr:hypothetical protein BCR33DRAFT_80961 [Rhizoclosmatium globosum]|eukprot:ORY47882.1 hypothetical protein BCR33DRAFT_80961 [Rhizoclosmatium globosum]
MPAERSNLSRFKRCDECRKHKKGCSQDKDGCISCKAKGVPCVYINDPSLSLAEEPSNDLDASQSTSFVQLDANFTGPSLNPSVNPKIRQVLEEYLTAWESPVIDQSSSFELEDTDLLPTMDDFLLVFNYSADYGNSVSNSDAFDVQSLLAGFFKKPAVLR